MEYLVFGRTTYADPLAKVASVTSEGPPGLDDLDVGDDWLELVVIPGDRIVWVLRDGDATDAVARPGGASEGAA